MLKHSEKECCIKVGNCEWVDSMRSGGGCKEMKLTCVTATFNCINAGNRESLIRCIESVSKLKIEHEHLIYDANSTDGTVALLRELESRINGLKVTSEADTGIYNAINKGVRDARGEWFYVLGADDFILNPETLDKLLTEEDCDQIVTECVTHDRIRPVAIDGIFCTSPYCHQGTVVKTKVLRSFGGFDERYKICADYDFFLKLHKAARDIRFSRMVFAYYDARGVSHQMYHATIVDDSLVASRHFSPSFEEYMDFRLHGRRPSLFLALRYCFHPDYALRHAARLNLLRNLFFPILICRRAIMNKKKNV